MWTAMVALVWLRATAANYNQLKECGLHNKDEAVKERANERFQRAAYAYSS